MESGQDLGHFTMMPPRALRALWGCRGLCSLRLHSTIANSYSIGWPQRQEHLATDHPFTWVRRPMSFRATCTQVAHSYYYPVYKAAWGFLPRLLCPGTYVINMFLDTLRDICQGLEFTAKNEPAEKKGFKKANDLSSRYSILQHPPYSKETPTECTPSMAIHRSHLVPAG